MLTVVFAVATLGIPMLVMGFTFLDVHAALAEELGRAQAKGVQVRVPELTPAFHGFTAADMDRKIWLSGTLGFQSADPGVGG